MGVGNGQMRLFWDVPWDEEFYADAIARSTGDMQRRELQLARATQLLVRNALNRLLGDDIVALERCDTSWVGVYDDRRAAYAAARAAPGARARRVRDRPSRRRARALPEPYAPARHEGNPARVARNPLPRRRSRAGRVRILDP